MVLSGEFNHMSVDGSQQFRLAGSAEDHDRGRRQQGNVPLVQGIDLRLCYRLTGFIEWVGVPCFINLEQRRSPGRLKALDEGCADPLRLDALRDVRTAVTPLKAGGHGWDSEPSQ